ncbi:hypothetical protein OSTOST_07170, partial [Ostertagia ostertagi]
MECLAFTVMQWRPSRKKTVKRLADKIKRNVLQPLAWSIFIDWSRTASYCGRARELIPLVKHHLAADYPTTSQTSGSEDPTADVTDEETYAELDSFEEGSSFSSPSESRNESTPANQPHISSRNVTNIKEEAEFEYERFLE